MVSCFSENAVNVSQPHSLSLSSSCSSFSNKAYISPTLTPSIQNSVSSLYKTTLSNQSQKHFFITITWFKSHSNQGLTISFGKEEKEEIAFKLNTNSRLFRKMKGSKLLESNNNLSKIEICYDLCNARYDTSPEPVDGFYVAILVDEEIVLVLGEQTAARKLETRRIPSAKATLISRRERCHCSCNNATTTLYATTKAQFCYGGALHDIVIGCSGGENEGLKYPVLSVCIDNKTVIRVKKLQWNFRGNQTIFVDGLLVDLLWDVHNWFFNNNNNSNNNNNNNYSAASDSASSGEYAVFMFRTRSGLDSRLWLEEKTVLKDQDRDEFSLLIYACKSR
ncbi:hypothetical protein RIF29_27550 [Crotalaria pallida]|uniref:Uncharacterized protein n=1 Tax=Crotalaria pallida TaxID=3830 RepID=A0AAN9EWH2_CROPI